MARKREPNDFIDTFSAVKKRVSAVMGEAYGAAEVGTMQAKLMRALGRSAPISQADLARATDSDPTLTGRVLAGLIERGWIKRERSDEDRREYVLDVTAAGKRALDKIEKIRGPFVARINAALDDRDLDDFERIAAKILAALAAEDA